MDPSFKANGHSSKFNNTMQIKGTKHILTVTLNIAAYTAEKFLAN
jgi:hypothetical protein